MSYSITISCFNVRILASRISQTLEELKRRWGKDPDTQDYAETRIPRNLSKKVVREKINAGDLEGVLSLFGFSVEEEPISPVEQIANDSDSGNLLLLSPDVNLSLEGHETLWDALALSVESGGYVEYVGEDDATWRVRFNGTHAVEQYSRLVWDGEEDDLILQGKNIHAVQLYYHLTDIGRPDIIELLKEFVHA